MAEENPPEGLGRLLDDMFREGWMSGLGIETDMVYERMDFETGLYNRTHFERLLDGAIEDQRLGKKRRERDGPAEGKVSVLAVRIANWGDIAKTQSHELHRETVGQLSDSIKSTLRVDDVIGRTASDTFSLLLRGCPTDMLDKIAARCVVDLKELRIETREGWVSLEATAGAAEWEGGSSSELVEAAHQKIG